VSAVKYELGCYIPEDAILQFHFCLDGVLQAVTVTPGRKDLSQASEVGQTQRDPSRGP
jgi:hypothetical protein